MAEEKKAKAKKPTRRAKKPLTRKAEDKKAETKKAAPKKAASKGEAPSQTRCQAKDRAKPKKETAKPAPIVIRASARYVRIAPRKARLIADQVRGLHIDKARALLQFSPRGAAHDIHKLIESAASNAENNHDLIADEMRIAEITVDEGPTLKRFRPRALGRATPIHKRTSHIAVALSPEED